MPRGQDPKNPVLVSSMGYRKAVVRHCTEQLREIEGRLEQPSGPRWEQMMQNCEDIAGVARLVLALQRRTELKGSDIGWLEELSQLSSAECDERAIDFTRKLKHRLDALREAVPYSVDPATLIGATVVRSGDASSGGSRGQVIEHDCTTGFRVLYADGDAEDLALRELQPLLHRRERSSRTTPSAAEADEAAGASTAAITAFGLDEQSIFEQSVQTLFEAMRERHARNAVEAPTVASKATAAERRPKPAPPPTSAGSQPPKAPAKAGKKASKRAGADAEPPSKRPRSSTPLATVTEPTDEASAAVASAAPAAPPVAVPAPASAAPPPSVPPALAAPALTASVPASAAPAPAPSSLPEYGLSLVEVEAAAAGPRKRLPRELRNLAMPDREWNVAVPFFTTAAKTREQFSSSADTQAAAAVAREMHQQRIEEARAEDSDEDANGVGAS